ncbi:MAG TPA: helix-turn-helix domain-containing protein [Candidatus Thermoplasmatota archaeon]|nr:helix-turn-helix domain-containing protein [Candidatus Thermoplasmatota archaeon]
MKVYVVIAVVALSGLTGLAAGVSLLQGPLAPPPVVPALSDSHTAAIGLAPEPIAPLAAAQTVPAPARILASATEALSADTERIDKLPTFILLPDGALFAAYDTIDDDSPLMRGILLRDPAPAPPRLAPSAPLAGSPALERRTDSPGFAGDFGSPRATPAPAPQVEQQAAVFDPRPTHVLPSMGALVGGGFALAALAGLGVLLYHRIRPNAALENETRKVIFDSVCGTPGLGVHEISRTAGVSYSTATYHLERLLGAGMIVMTPDGNKLCYYKNGGAFSESERKVLPLVKNEEAAKLFEAIVDSPGTYRAALAEKLGVTATTINWHLRRLREAGLVDETRQGRSAHLYARTDQLKPLFLTLATKVETSEPIVAQRLRKYAGPVAGDMAGGVGAA